MTFLCDTGERYLSKVFNDEWMRENQLLEPDRVTLGDLLDHKGDGAPATLVSAAPGQLVRQALGLMRLHDVSQLPVLENGECVGSVTEYALTQRGLESSRFLDAVVGEVMDEAFPGRRCGAARRVGPEAALEGDARRAGAPERRDRGDRDAERHARVSDGRDERRCRAPRGSANTSRHADRTSANHGT